MTMMSRWAPRIYGTASVVVALIVWQLIAASGRFGQALPTATASIGAAADLLIKPTTWIAIGITVLTAVVGLLISAVLGIILGIFLGTSRVFTAATRVVIEFLKPIPPIVILPVVVLVLGPKIDMAVFLVVFGCMLPIAVQTAAGVLETNPVALDTARSFQLNRFQILSRVVLPSASPFIANSVRVNAPASLIIAVVAGLFGGAPGLGYLLFRAVQTANSQQIFALVLIMGLIGLIFQYGSIAIEKKLLPWQPAFREVAR